jgi:carbamoyltransferase
MNILGMHLGHDSSVCLIKDGRIEKYFLSERLSKKKHESKLHIPTIKEIINSYNPQAVSFSGNSLGLLDQINFKTDALYDYTDHHHFLHSHIAYRNSGFDKSLVFVIDGMGSLVDYENGLRECESVYLYTNGKSVNLYKNIVPQEIGVAAQFNIPDSFNPVTVTEHDCKNLFGIGILYDTAAVVTGNTVDDCGKAMGLSSYGQKNDMFKKMFIESNNLNNDFFLKKITKNFLSNPAKNITKENYKLYADYCYEVQQQTQKAVGDLIEEYVKQSGVKNVCMSGGYAMNVVANYYLLSRFPNINFYFEPMCNDSGLSIGAAMHLYSKMKKSHQPEVRSNTTTSFHGYNYSYSRFSQYGVKESIIGITNKLKNNKSIAVYSGLAEAGQRALGNRSILFNALNPDAKEIVNKIKNREWYRPFAAVVLQEDANFYFDMKLMPSSPYMTVAFPTKTDLVPGVTHVDNTCRVQTVTKTDGYLYDLLVEFKRITGHGILLNTSLNLAGDPLVETPQEAFNVLMSSNLDYLWFPEISRVYDHSPVYTTDSL